MQRATLTAEERERMSITGVLLVVCEDCYHGVDFGSDEAYGWSSVY